MLSNSALRIRALATHGLVPSQKLISSLTCYEQTPRNRDVVSHFVFAQPHRFNELFLEKLGIGRVVAIVSHRLHTTKQYNFLQHSKLVGL
jgi:hypothetical protein